MPTVIDSANVRRERVRGYTHFSTLDFSRSYGNITLRYSDRDVSNLRDALDFNKFVHCRDCGNYFNPRLNPNYPRLNERLCLDCLRHYSTCDACHRHYRGDYCDYCHMRCNDCGNIVLISELENDDLGLCNDCVYNYQCETCGELFGSEYSLESHMNDYHGPTVRILNYSYKPTPNFLHLENERTKRFFGIECEFEFNDNDKDGIDCLKEGIDNRLFYLKYDGSLNDGAELVTHPASKKYWIKNSLLKEELACLIASGYRSHETDTCGLHIHVSRDSAKIAIWAKVTLFWYSHDNFIKALCRRIPGHYCHKKNVSPDDDSETITYSEDRYEAINFENRKTVEFRQFKGTLNHETIIASILFVDWLIRFCGKKTNQELVQASAVNDFIQYAKNNCTDLYRYIKSRFNTTI